MTLFYLDSSAWVKRYFQEPGSDWMIRLFQSGESLASSGLGYVEVAAALARQQLSRKLGQPAVTQLQKQLDEDWTAMTGLACSDQVLTLALQLTRTHKLRGADAVHLATALVAREALTGSGNDLVLVAADQELLAVAQMLGMAIENPVGHASP